MYAETVMPIVILHANKDDQMCVKRQLAIALYGWLLQWNLKVNYVVEKNIMHNYCENNRGNIYITFYVGIIKH